MTKRHRIWGSATLGTLVATLGLGAAAFAADDVSLEAEGRPRHREFRLDSGVTGGGHFFNKQHGLRDNFDDPTTLSPANAGAVGLQLDIHLASWLSLEAEGLATRTQTRDSATSLWIYQFGGQFLVHPLTLGPVQPYLLLGYGAIASWVDDHSILQDDQDGLGRAGLGLKIAFTDRVGLRLEGRVLAPLAFASKFWSVGDETAFGGPDFQALGGFYLALGEVEDRLVVREKVVVKETPNPDPDHDGVVGRADRCPDVAEDQDGFEDEDGCPDFDNDQDGIADAKDKCPLKGELMNQIDDEDGCPEEDTDSDGLLGSLDECPTDPETKNGFKDKDGCPDELPPAVKRFTGVIAGINFKSRSAKLLANSSPLLDRALAVLKEYPEIKLEIAGHTDAKGKGDFNRDLSQQRAEAVRAYFITRGIAPERVVAVGYGMDHPIATNRNESGRSKNRRTEFKIVTN